MALNIDGTTGISGVDGSASAASIAGTDANTGLSFASDTVNINTGGVTRATIDSSGRLLLGTSTTGSSTADDFTIETTGSTGITLRSGTSSDGNLFFSDGTSGADEYRGYIQYGHASNILLFGTNASERMRIDSSGRILFNTNSYSSVGNGSVNASYIYNGSLITSRDNTGNREHAVFHNPNGDVGSINTSGSSTSYTTSSDYRLKENATAISDGITRLKTLKPYRFNFKVDKDTTVDGFFAHEVTAVPEAITGTKDETQDILYTEEDTIPSGKKVGDVKETVPKYQGIDQSKLVPLLTAALQEAVAKIEVLETKVAALEAA